MANIASTDKTTFEIDFTRADATRVVRGLQLLHRETLKRNLTNQKSDDSFLNTSAVEIGLAEQSLLERLVAKCNTAIFTYDGEAAKRNASKTFAISGTDEGTFITQSIDWVGAVLNALDEWGLSALSVESEAHFGSTHLVWIFDPRANEGPRDGVRIAVTQMPDDFGMRHD